MRSQILSLSQQLITIPSVTSDKKELKKILALVEKKLQGLTIEKFESNGFSSLLIYKEKTRPKKFKIILNAHLDVVAAAKKQFTPVIRNGRLYGRGAQDMKAAAAVEILVFRELVKKVNYPLALQIVTDEETNGWYGTKYQLEQGISSEFALVGEQSALDITYRTKGIIWVKVSCQGKPAHGAYPWLGENAIWKMVNFLQDVQKKYPVPGQEVWHSTVNLARIETANTTTNRVPWNCSAYFDIRFVYADKNTVLKDFKTLLPQGFTLEIIENEPSHYIDPQNAYFQRLARTVKKVTGKQPEKLSKNGGSDMRHFSLFNCPGVEFGPKGANLHGDNEYVEIKSLEKYYRILKEFLTAI